MRNVDAALTVLAQSRQDGICRALAADTLYRIVSALSPCERALFAELAAV
jgi:hypothetical protein